MMQNLRLVFAGDDSEKTRMNPRGQVAPQTQLRRVPATPPLLFVSGTGGAAGAI